MHRKVDLLSTCYSFLYKLIQLVSARQFIQVSKQQSQTQSGRKKIASRFYRISLNRQVLQNQNDTTTKQILCNSTHEYCVNKCKLCMYIFPITGEVIIWFNFKNVVAREQDIRTTWCPVGVIGSDVGLPSQCLTVLAENSGVAVAACYLSCQTSFNITI